MSATSVDIYPMNEPCETKEGPDSRPKSQSESTLALPHTQPYETGGRSHPGGTNARRCDGLPQTALRRQPSLHQMSRLLTFHKASRAKVQRNERDKS